MPHKNIPLSMLIRHNPKLLPILKEKENVEMSIKFYQQDKSILRFNHVTISTKYYNPIGGIASMTTDRLKVHEESAKYLKKMYPEYGYILVRPDGRHEFRLKRNPKP